jgi:hypothetical protein
LALYTIDSEKNHHPKLKEFRHFIKHKLNIRPGEQVLVFADDGKLQKQLKRVLQEEQQLVSIFQGQKEVELSKNTFVIASFKDAANLPKAAHTIYLHLPYRSVKETKGELWPHKQQETNVYLFQAVESMEELFLQWFKAKNIFIDQLLGHLESPKTTAISLRLQEELVFKLKTFIKREDSKETVVGQMNLFGELEKQKAKINTKVNQSDDSFIQFLEVFKQALIAYEKLSVSSRHLLKEGKISVSEKEGDLLIRIRKKD